MLDLVRGLVARGHAVVLVYAPGRAERPFLDALDGLGVEALVPLPMKRAPGPGDVLAAARLSAIVRRLGHFDILHGHSSKAGALVRLIPAAGKRVYTAHGLRTLDPKLGRAARLFYAGIEGFLGRWCSDAVIAVSDRESDHMRGLGIPDRVLRKVVNGVAPGEPAERASLRAALGLAPEDIALGFVGRLANPKAPEVFVEVVARCAEADARVRGVIVGDGEFGDQVRAQVAALGLGERLLMLGFREARPLMPAFDVLVMTSYYEAMPYVLLEALDAGLPIVSTDVGGMAEAVMEGRNGHVVPVNRPVEPMAEALRGLVADADRRRAMAAASRALAADYSVERMVWETEAVYRSLL